MKKSTKRTTYEMVKFLQDKSMATALRISQDEDRIISIGHRIGKLEEKIKLKKERETKAQETRAKILKLKEEIKELRRNEL